MTNCPSILNRRFVLWLDSADFCVRDVLVGDEGLRSVGFSCVGAAPDVKVAAPV